MACTLADTHAVWTLKQIVTFNNDFSLLFISVSLKNHTRILIMLFIKPPCYSRYPYWYYFLSNTQRDILKTLHIIPFEYNQLYIIHLDEYTLTDQCNFSIMQI